VRLEKGSMCVGMVLPTIVSLDVDTPNYTTTSSHEEPDGIDRSSRWTEPLLSLF
jgi:hypothetical protein